MSAAPETRPFAALLAASFFSDRDAFTYPVETYEDWVILGSQGGEFAFQLGLGDAGNCTEGELVIAAPGVPLKREIKGRARFFFLRFSLHAAFGVLPTGKCAVLDVARLYSTLGHLRKIEAGAVKPHSSLWANHLLADLLYQARFDRIPADLPAPDPRMVHAARLLSEVGSEAGRATLEQIAKKLRLTPSQFSRAFRQAHGQSPAAFRTEQRLKHAKHLLLNTHWKLERIAEACGFENAFYLSRVFGREVGTAPSEFRKANRV